jgi:hypothetical protein
VCVPDIVDDARAKRSNGEWREKGEAKAKGKTAGREYAEYGQTWLHPLLTLLDGVRSDTTGSRCRYDDDGDDDDDDDDDGDQKESRG